MKGTTTASKTGKDWSENEAIAEIIVKIGFQKRPLLPDRRGIDMQIGPYVVRGRADGSSFENGISRPVIDSLPGKGIYRVPNQRTLKAFGFNVRPSVNTPLVLERVKPSGSICCRPCQSAAT